ncbi:MAG: xylulokinase, partial [Acidimicrobiia bacterium]
AVAADGEGRVVARSRVPHRLLVPAPDRLEHDAGKAWRDGPRAALAELGDVRPRAVCVAAMVPSLTAVDGDGNPITPGLLYGDVRGRTGSRKSPAESGEMGAFLRWAAQEAPGARGYWPAQAVANYALGGEGVIDTMTAATAHPLFDWSGWDASAVEAAGVHVDQLARIANATEPAGQVGDAVLAAGTIDAMGEQIVAGADDDGDVLVILGTTLITWAVLVPAAGEVPAVPSTYYAIPHTAAGKWLAGGPSNAGGLFLDWVRRLVGDGPPATDRDRVPVWVPYPRGERVPLHDPDRRAVLADADLTHDAGSVRRAAFEAAGFVVRRTLDDVAPGARRLVATGGGIRVAEWVQSLADCTRLPVDVVDVPEGGALGAAFLARVAAGLETDMTDGRRWARLERRVEPDPRWAEATARRYRRFRDLAG